MSRHRLLLRVAMAAAVALVIAVAAWVGVGLAGTGGPSLSGKARSGTARDSKPAEPLGVPVPAQGAYMGAYVQPAVDTPAGQISAVQSFEQPAGFSLSVHVYHPWGRPSRRDADATSSTTARFCC